MGWKPARQARTDDPRPVDGIFPNGANIIGIKPAERGTIQLITTNGKGEITGVYPLTKVLLGDDRRLTASKRPGQ